MNVSGPLVARSVRVPFEEAAPPDGAESPGRAHAGYSFFSTLKVIFTVEG